MGTFDRSKSRSIQPVDYDIFTIVKIVAMQYTRQMQKLLVVNKPIGVTPYQVIQTLREQHPPYQKEKISYVGRLDPLAHGVLLLTVGAANNTREAYLSLPKEYECEALFGLATDTYDLLGLVQNLSIKKVPDLLEEKIATTIKSYVGKEQQSYPPFSSKAVHGKPLFWWAKQDRLSEITIPTREISVTDFTLLSLNACSRNELEKKVSVAISVQGDFRQEAIKKRWETFFTTNTQSSFVTARLHVSCSSGTYIRSFINRLGESLGCYAVATEIMRTSVGAYSVDSAINLTLE